MRPLAQWTVLSRDIMNRGRRSRIADDYTRPLFDEGFPAVDNKGLAGDVAGLVAGEE